MKAKSIQYLATISAIPKIGAIRRPLHRQDGVDDAAQNGPVRLDGKIKRLLNRSFARARLIRVVSYVGHEIDFLAVRLIQE